MRIPSAFLDKLRGHISMPSIVRQNVKLVRSGREWKGCCPFHSERTPSFYVYPDHYHCFGCGAHGDIIRYVMEIYSLSFVDAVSSLAQNAGLSVPKEEETSQQISQRQHMKEKRERFYRLLALAANWFHHNLYLPQYRAGLTYLYQRGVTDETIKQFALGWAPRQSGLLRQYLQNKGFSDQMMCEVGLLRQDDSSGAIKGEWFFDRVIFPIYDDKGRVISFGGRKLGDGQPKYLNGCETSLFSKRRILFNYHRAWDCIKQARMKRDRKEIIVVEGYLDVIKLAQGGFENAVAPLGTSLTEEQLEKIWRISSTPILCFDGDNAGRKAVIRSAQLALSKLDTEHMVRCCLLPQGEDPDSFLSNKGYEAMETLLKTSSSLSDIVFDILSRGTDGQRPEARARLRKQLLDLAQLIPDKLLASEYRKAFLDRFFEKYRRRFAGRKDSQYGSKANITVEKGVAMAPSRQAVNLERQRQMFAILCIYPPFVREVEDILCRMDIDARFIPLRDQLLDLSAAEKLPQNGKELRQYLSEEGEEDLLKPLAPMPSSREIEALSIDELKKRWWDFYMLLNQREMVREVQESVTQFLNSGSQDEQTWRKLKERLLFVERLRNGLVQ